MIVNFVKYIWGKFMSTNQPKEKITMSVKDDAVAAGLAAVQAGETQVLTDQLGAIFDKGEAIGTGPGFTQADIDAAVKAAVDPLNLQISTDAQTLADSQAADAKSASDAKAVADAALADLQSKFDALSTKEGVEAGVITGLQSSKAQIEAALASLSALFPPVVTPDPVPAA